MSWTPPPVWPRVSPLTFIERAREAKCLLSAWACGGGIPSSASADSSCSGGSDASSSRSEATAAVQRSSEHEPPSLWPTLEASPLVVTADASPLVETADASLARPSKRCACDCSCSSSRSVRRVSVLSADSPARRHDSASDASLTRAPSDGIGPRAASRNGPTARLPLRRARPRALAMACRSASRVTPSRCSRLRKAGRSASSLPSHPCSVSPEQAR